MRLGSFCWLVWREAGLGPAGVFRRRDENDGHVFLEHQGAFGGVWFWDVGRRSWGFWPLFEASKSVKELVKR